MTKARVKLESSKSKKSTTKVEETTNLIKNKTDGKTKNMATKKTKTVTTTTLTPKVSVLNVDKLGLSLTLGKIRKLLLDVVLNLRFRQAEKELKENKETLLEASNLKEGYLSYHGFSKETREYLRELLNSHIKIERTKYERKQLKTLLANCSVDDSKNRIVPPTLQSLLNNRKQLLKDESNNDVNTLFEQYDKKFYKNFTESTRIFSLTGEDAYKFYQSLIVRNKIRINNSGMLRLTAFLELILQQLVSQMLSSCITNNKTTVNFSTMTGTTTLPENYLCKLVNNLTSWNTAVEWQNNGRVVDSETKQTPSFVNESELNPGNKFKSTSYIVDICKNVERKLTSSTPVKLSKETKTLCGLVLLELVHTFGQLLRVISKDNNITSNTVDTLVQTYHLVHNESKNLTTTMNELNRMMSNYTELQNKLTKERTTTSTKTS
jgi:hypothetical protein